MHHSSLSLTTWIAIAAAGTGVAALLLGAINAWVSLANERKRTQPIVIAHEEYGRRFTDSAGDFAVGSYITNESAGHAFNVRFGVELHGIRYPQKLRVEDPDSGNVQRVLRPGERRPTEGSWPVLVSLLPLIGSGDDDPDPGRLYWARYENARKQTWETRNPWERSARLDIKRVRLPRLREWREQRQRTGSETRGITAERVALAELRAGMTPVERDEAGEVGGSLESADIRRSAEENSVDYGG